MRAWGCRFASLCLVPSWKQGQKLGKLEVSGPGHFGLMVAEVIISFPGLSLERAIWPPTSLTDNRLASQAVCDGRVGWGRFPGQGLGSAGQSSFCTQGPATVCSYRLSHHLLSDEEAF